MCIKESGQAKIECELRNLVKQMRIVESGLAKIIADMVDLQNLLPDIEIDSL